MLFSSVVFLFYFLPLFFFFYASLRSRNAVLLVGSLIFYAWSEARYLWLLFLVGVIAWVGGWRIHSARLRGQEYRALLTCTIGAELLLLTTFKYAPFLGSQLSPLFPVLARHTPGGLALPLGISFFTFHAISYVMDIHRGAVSRPATPLQLAVYLAMFPQLIAGPIVRYATIAGEIAQHRRLSLVDLSSGIRLFVLGLAQKVLLANTLASPADRIFALPAASLDSGTAWFGTLCYSLQIYLDFSGYSLMAIGLARMMGLNLPVNFRHPYVSQSITEFWRRWHITLSRWFRDYLYIPLGGNQRGALRTTFNLFLVFLLCGLWHGAAWSFVLWGAYHGSFLVLERAGLARLLARSSRLLRHAYTLLVVGVGWVLFRASTATHAATMMRAMAGFGAPMQAGFAQYTPPSVLAALGIGALVSTPFTTLSILSRIRLGAVFPAAHAGMLALLLILSAASLADGTYNPFIYFRF